MVGDGVKEIVTDVRIWSDLLDEFEAVLDDHRRRLDPTALTTLQTSDLPRFVPPATVPPIPLSLRSRAIGLSEQANRLITEVRTAADRIAPRAAAPRARILVPATSSAAFDEMA
jgi:hypothetical protein